MTIRLLAAAVAIPLLMLGGCAVQPPQMRVKPPDQRNQEPFQCTTNPCRVEIDPDADEWVREFIRINRGGVIHFAIRGNKVRFDSEGIRFKTPAGREAIECPNAERGPFLVVCKLTPKAQPNVKYEYGIKVQGRPEYDPFLWPRD